jgi:hypothetical protein
MDRKSVRPHETSFGFGRSCSPEHYEVGAKEEYDRGNTDSTQGNDIAEVSRFEILANAFRTIAKRRERTKLFTPRRKYSLKRTIGCHIAQALAIN